MEVFINKRVHNKLLINYFDLLIILLNIQNLYLNNNFIHK